MGKNPDKEPVPKPGNGSAANKQLTGQLCIMYLPFTFTLAAFIISSCCRRKLGNAAIKDIFHCVQDVVGTLLLPRWCYQTKHRFSCKFPSPPTGCCHVQAPLYAASALKPAGPACGCRYRCHLCKWRWWRCHLREGTWLTLHLSMRESVFSWFLQHKINFRTSLADTRTINRLTATTRISWQTG